MQAVARPVLLALHAMATRFELVLAGADEARLRAAGETALEEVRDCERRFNRFDPASLVSLLNREAARRWVRVDGDALELLERCEAIRRESGGAFDARIGARTDAPGEGPVAGELLFDGARSAVRFTDADVALDLGAIAKGHALDLAAGVLRELGVESALLHGGTSSAIAIGAPPGESAWRIAIGRERAAPLAHLRDAALAVSAPHGRTLRGGGHVLDPRSGRSAERFAYAAVIHASAREADAWSTASLVDGLELARRRALTALVAERDPDERPRWSASSLAHGASRFELPPQSTPRCTNPTAGTS